LIAVCGGELRAQDRAEPFQALRRQGQGQPALVPPRALAVIPERHTGRMLRMVDVLVAIDPEFGDAARTAGLGAEGAIQLRTREARVPIFVEKSESTIATLLQLPIGARVEVTGVLVERSNQYLFLAAGVRPATRLPR
jgi:hypothetical protein